MLVPTRVPLDFVDRVYGFWGRHPGLYAAQDYVTFLGQPGRVRRAAVAALGLPEGGTVLEVACGSGRNFPHLIGAIGPRGHLVGFDYSQSMLGAAAESCRRRGWKQVELIQGDAAALDVGARRFDGVLCVLGMSAIPDWRRALARCRDVLVPGGTLSVCDARLFSSPALAWLNPAITRAYAAAAAWAPDRDIPGAMQAIFGNVRTRSYNAGTFVVATSIRRSEA